MNQISFTSKVYIDFDSVKKNMPEQLDNVLDLKNELSKNGRHDDVFIQAVENGFCKLSIVTQDNELETFYAHENVEKDDVYALRLFLINDCNKKYGFVPSIEKEKIDKRCKKLLEEIERTPFNVGKAILKLYQFFYLTKM